MSSSDTAPPLQAALDSIPLAFGILDSTGELIFINRAWQENEVAGGLALQPASIGISYLETLSQSPDETIQTAVAGLSALLAGDRSTFELDYQVDKRWFRMRAMSYEQDREQFVVVTHREITAQMELEREQAQFERAIENAGHAIFITTVDGEITYVNPAFEIITGYEPTEAIGQTPRLLKSNEMDREFYDDLWETITAGKIWKGTLVNRRKSGELYYAQQTIAPLVGTSGTVTHFVAIQTDVTEAREKHKQIEKLENIFRHDLRNRINVAVGYANLLVEHGDPETREYATTLSETLAELLSSVKKARQLQSILSTTTTPKPRNIAQIARDVVATQLADNPGATIRFDGPTEAIGLCISDIDRAIAELIENSLTHTDTDSPEISVVVESRDNWTEIRVVDNGPGIPEMESEPLETDVMSQLYHDTGFGLNQVYWITRRSGGRLEFSDNTPRGSVVTIQLPPENT